MGLSPTSSISTRDPGRAAAATIQNAAEEKSPGTASDCPTAPLAAGDVMAFPVALTSNPNAASARSVWSRVCAGSVTDVCPSA